MTYFVASLLAIPITLVGLIGILKSREMAKRLMQFLQERDGAELADIGAAPLPEFHDELRFTQSLLALSKVRSPERGGFPVPEPAESSSLVLVHRTQSKTPDPVA